VPARCARHVDKAKRPARAAAACDNDGREDAKYDFRDVRDERRNFFPGRFGAWYPAPVTTRRMRAEDRTAFESIARSLARSLKAGDVVALSGALGAGKTAFVAAAVEELQACVVTSSPTFLFWQRYPGPPAVEHLDFYRIETPEDAAELGLHEAFESGNIAFVEWPERLASLIPPPTVHVRIEGSGDQPRMLTIETPT